MMFFLQCFKNSPIDIFKFAPYLISYLSLGILSKFNSHFCFIQTGIIGIDSVKGKHYSYFLNLLFFNLFLMVLVYTNSKGLEIYINKSYFIILNKFLNIEPNFVVDNITLTFCTLSFFLTPICLLISWDSMNFNFMVYVTVFSFLQYFLVNVFCAGDLLVFYISFECILIPMFFLIGMLGSRQRRVHATFVFFLYTLGGSLLMLVGIILCNYQYGTTNVNGLVKLEMAPVKECFIWFCFFIAFSVKIPLMPVHLWLPEAHVESPTGGSVALAGILLKLGTYGMLRFLLPLFPFSSQFFSSFVYLICFIGILFGCLTTLRQIDIKKVIAYSSVIHMNYLVLGLFTFTSEGLVGSLILMIAHAFVSGGLFVCVGILYDRYSTRLIKYYGGLTTLMPLFSTFFLLFTLANISFPGTFNFIGEFFVLLGLFIDNPCLAILTIFVMILSTCYALWLYNKLFSGLLTSYLLNTSNKFSSTPLFFKRSFFLYFNDINLREFYCLVYLLLPTLMLGVIPIFFLDWVEAPLINVINSFYNGV